MRAFRIPVALLVAVVVIGCVDGPTMPPSDGVVPEFSRNNNRASRDRGAPTLEWVEEVFIDYGSDPSHAGPGPDPAGESATFRLTQGGIRWPAGGAGEVKYKITNTEDVTGGNTAIGDAFSTYGPLILRTFTVSGTPGQNKCGVENEVIWESIDGPGGILATASVCASPATKEIDGFVITLDTDEDWRVAASGVAGKFDVENVMAHEFGHVAGLGHVNAPKDGCLTMYKLAGRGEIQKRTLGLGDQRGMKALYGLPTNPVAGSCVPFVVE